MLKTFRNIAATLITWYIYGFVGGLLQFVSQLVIPRHASTGQPGSTFLMILGGALPYVLVAGFAGALLINVVKPRGDSKWVRLLAAIIAIGHFAHEASAGPISERSAEEIAGVLLAGALLLAAVLVGAALGSRRGRPSPEP